MLEVSFWAQSLDNIAPEDMEINGCPLATTEKDRRQDLVHRISRVSKSGKQVFLEGNNSVFLLKNEFILEVVSDQRDTSGRIAPILCYGQVPDKPSDVWADKVVKALKAFAERIDRSVSDKHASSGLQGLINKTLRKKKLKRELGYTIVVGVVLVLAYLIWQIKK